MKKRTFSPFWVFSAMLFTLQFGMLFGGIRNFNEINEGKIYAIIICTVIVCFSVFLISRSMHNPEKIKNSKIFRAFSLFLGVYFILRSALDLRGYDDISHLYLLEKTPSILISIIILITAYFLFRKGLRSLALNAQAFFWVAAIPIVFLIGASLFFVDFRELFAFFSQSSVTNIPNQIYPTLSSLMGFELIFFIILGNERKNGTEKAAIWGIVVAGGLNIIFTMVLAGIFSVPGMNNIVFQLSEVSKIIGALPSLVTERADIIFVCIQLLITVMQTALTQYMAAICFESFFKTKDYKFFGIVQIPITALAAFLCARVNATAFLYTLLPICNAVLLALPLLWFLITKIKRKKGGKA